MKRFLVFTGMDYYPYGGWRDFLDSFQAVEEAKKSAEILFDITDEHECASYICREHGKKKRSIRPNNYRADWAQIVDTQTGQVLALGEPKSWCEVCETKPEWPVWE